MILQSNARRQSADTGGDQSVVRGRLENAVAASRRAGTGGTGSGAGAGGRNTMPHYTTSHGFDF